MKWPRCPKCSRASTGEADGVGTPRWRAMISVMWRSCTTAAATACSTELAGADSSAKRASLANVRAMHRRPADRSLTDVRCDATFADGLGNRAGETVVAVGGSRRTHERTPMPRKERASVAVAALNPQGRDASGHFRRVRRPRWRTGREPGRPCLCEHERPVRAGKRSSHRPHCTAISRRHCGKVAAPCDVVLKRKMDNASRLRGRLCKAGESSRSSHCTAARTASRRFADSSDRARPTPDVRFRPIR